MSNNTKGNEIRYLGKESKRHIFIDLKEFEKYWLNHNKEWAIRLSETQEETLKVTKKTTDKISSEFKEGDEIIHFDDFGIAPERCEREFILLRRDGKIVKSILIRMS